jgi:hypothetical protein
VLADGVLVGLQVLTGVCVAGSGKLSAMVNPPDQSSASAV